jgi:hypothetical protein
MEIHTVLIAVPPRRINAIMERYFGSVRQQTGRVLVVMPRICLRRSPNTKSISMPTSILYLPFFRETLMW